MFKHNPVDLVGVDPPPRGRLDTIAIITQCRIRRTAEPYCDSRAETETECTALPDTSAANENYVRWIRSLQRILET
jgi:hypothetical protein